MMPRLLVSQSFFWASQGWDGSEHDKYLITFLINYQGSRLTTNHGALHCYLNVPASSNSINATIGRLLATRILWYVNCLGSKFLNWDKEKIISAFLGQNFPMRGVGTFLVYHLTLGTGLGSLHVLHFLSLQQSEKGPLLSPRNRGSQRLNDLFRVLDALNVRPRGWSLAGVYDMEKGNQLHS